MYNCNELAERILLIYQILGLETAKSLAKHGCEVILACRNLAKAEQAKESIKALKPTAMVDIVELDLESLTSVKNCANEVLIKFR